MEKKIRRCSDCGFTEDADVIEATGLCTTCAHRAAIDGLMRAFRANYEALDRNAER